jgi:curli production assembly/transport component CsgG
MNLIRCATALTLMVFISSSCSSVFWQPMQHRAARIGETTPYGSILDSLPQPKEELIAAVYQFRDQTGQYKPSEGGSSFSTAVTQGAATILVKVLEESKWFAPIERENIGNLLNERKNEELPALLYAGVMLEGGIISYDANVITGGAGLRYFGTGGSSQYRQDRVTVYLRAISTSNGKILKTVYSSKTILSQAMDGGVFRYVSFKRLLEAETGFSYNEPSEMAIKEAIETAVYSLIVEGIESNLWELKDSSKKKALLDKYHKEEEVAKNSDLLGQLNEPRRRKSDIGLNLNNILYKGDYARGRFTTGFSLSYNYNFSPRTSLGLRAYSGSFKTAGQYKSAANGLDLLISHRYLPWYKLTPYVQGGLGIVQTEADTKTHGLATVGLGLEYLIKPWLGIRLRGDSHYGFTDSWDNVERGVSRDFYYGMEAGLHFYFGGPIKSKLQSKTTKVEPKGKGVLQDF